MDKHDEAARAQASSEKICRICRRKEPEHVSRLGFDDARAECFRIAYERLQSALFLVDTALTDKSMKPGARVVAAFSVTRAALGIDENGVPLEP